MAGARLDRRVTMDGLHAVVVDIGVGARRPVQGVFGAGRQQDGAERREGG
jgi:hypothetical protein